MALSFRIGELHVAPVDGSTPAFIRNGMKNLNIPE